VVVNSGPQTFDIRVLVTMTTQQLTRNDGRGPNQHTVNLRLAIGFGPAKEGSGAQATPTAGQSQSAALSGDRGGAGLRNLIGAFDSSQTESDLGMSIRNREYYLLFLNEPIRLQVFRNANNFKTCGRWLLLHDSFLRDAR